MGRKPRYTKEFKLQALELLRVSGKSVGQIAKELGVAKSALYRWQRRDQPGRRKADSGKGHLRRGGAPSAATREPTTEDGAGVSKKSRGLLCQAERVRFDAIEAEKANYPIAMMCRGLEVSGQATTRAGVGRESWPDEDEANRQLATRLHEVYEASRRTYGSPRVHAELCVGGHEVGRHRVARLMRREGLAARKQKRFKVTTQSNHSEPVAPNVLARNFDLKEPNRAWAGDITYLPTAEGWLYLAALLDLVLEDRRRLGYVRGPRRHCGSGRPANGARTTKTARRSSAPQRPRRPVRQRKLPGCAGSQRGRPQHESERQLLERRSPALKSFFGTLKVEFLGDSAYFLHGLSPAPMVFDYVEVFYNRTRRHSSLGYVSPVDFEKLLA